MLMSEEEKKAIDDLFPLTHINGYIDLYTKKEVKINTLTLSKWQNGVKVLLNLIEKQSKEIEELKEDNKHQWEERCKLTFELENSTGKDKIKAKIEEYDKMINATYGDLTHYGDYRRDVCIEIKNVLQSLLEKE